MIAEFAADESVPTEVAADCAGESYEFGETLQRLSVLRLSVIHENTDVRLCVALRKQDSVDLISEQLFVR